MRPHPPAIALAVALATALAAHARADDDDPFTPDGTALPGAAELLPLEELPALAALRELPALPPLRDASSTPASAPARAPAPAPARASAPTPSPALARTPSTVDVPADPTATLGQYDEYRRALDAYSIDVDPVTAADYSRCVAAGRCTAPSCTQPDGPVGCVDLSQAKAYCAFAGRRLPTEDEWEHAARRATALGVRGTTARRLEWTASPYCYFCDTEDEVVRGGETRNPAKRAWTQPDTRSPTLGFRCAG
jgi:formylglycine-generating enzyme required for sulfatase activity